MSTVTGSETGQVVIPADLRRPLGITPGCQLDVALDGNTIRVELQAAAARRPEPRTATECCFRTPPGPRRLADFDVARAMREAADDRP